MAELAVIGLVISERTWVRVVCGLFFAGYVLFHLYLVLSGEPLYYLFEPGILICLGLFAMEVRDSFR